MRGLSLALGAAVLGLASNAGAATLYGQDSSGELLVIDSNTAAATQVGAQAGTPIGLAYNSADTRLYSISYGAQVLSWSTSDYSSQLEFSTLGGESGLETSLDSTRLFTIHQSNNSLVSYDIATGARVVIGVTGISGFVTDLAMNSSGDLFAASLTGNSIWQINPVTGAAVQVGSFIEALTGIAFDPTDDLWGVTIGGDILYSGILTGSPTPVGVISNYTDVRGLDFATSAATGAVPEPGTWAMMLMGFGAAGFAMRRRRAGELRPAQVG